LIFNVIASRQILMRNARRRHFTIHSAPTS
jgi:hypothetical protein